MSDHVFRYIALKKITVFFYLRERLPTGNGLHAAGIKTEIVSKMFVRLFMSHCIFGIHVMHNDFGTTYNAQHK